MQLYTADKYGLLQSIAVMDLLLQKWIEPSKGYSHPYDILFHQIISICHQMNGAAPEDLIILLKRNGEFYDLPETDICLLIEHMVKQDYLEQLSDTGQLIVD